MSKLPSILNTYLNTVSLYAKTFVSVMPFALIMGLAEHFYSDAIKLSSISERTSVSTHEWLTFVSYVFIYFVIYCLFFSIVTYGINQVKHQQPFSYEKAFRHGSARAIQLFISILILLSPVAIFFGGSILVGSVLNGYGIEESSSLMKLLVALYYLSMVGLGIAIFAIIIYCYVSSTLIVNYGYNAWQGLQQSWKMTKGHWFKTCMLVTILSLLLYLVSWSLGKIIGDYADEVMTVLSFSFGTSLIITHFENLNDVYQEKIIIPRIDDNH